MTKPATLSIPFGGRVLGVSRTVAYDEVKKTGKLAGVAVIRVGSRLRIPTVPFEAALGIDVADYLDDEPAQPVGA